MFWGSIYAATEESIRPHLPNCRTIVNNATILKNLALKYEGLGFDTTNWDPETNTLVLKSFKLKSKIAYEKESRSIEQEAKAELEADEEADALKLEHDRKLAEKRAQAQAKRDEMMKLAAEELREAAKSKQVLSFFLF